VAAAPTERPTYLSLDLEGLLVAHDAVYETPDGWTSGGWAASVAGGQLTVAGAGEPVDWWRSAAVAAWDHLDRTGEVVGTASVSPPVPGSEGAGR